MAAVTAGRKKLPTIPTITPAAIMRPTLRSVDPSTKRNVIPTDNRVIPSIRSPNTINFRREKRSAIAPPKGPRSTPGSAENIATRPIVVAEPVFSNNQ